LNKLKDPAVRRYIYTVVAALIPILLITGWLQDDWVTPILNAVAAILGLGSTALALPNTPDGRHEA